MTISLSTGAKNDKLLREHFHFPHLRVHRRTTIASERYDFYILHCDILSRSLIANIITARRHEREIFLIFFLHIHNADFLCFAYRKKIHSKNLHLLLMRWQERREKSEFADDGLDFNFPAIAFRAHPHRRGGEDVTGKRKQ